MGFKWVKEKNGMLKRKKGKKFLKIEKKVLNKIQKGYSNKKKIIIKQTRSPVNRNRCLFKSWFLALCLHCTTLKWSKKLGYCFVLLTTQWSISSYTTVCLGIKLWRKKPKGLFLPFMNVFIKNMSHHFWKMDQVFNLSGSASSSLYG